MDHQLAHSSSNSPADPVTPIHPAGCTRARKGAAPSRPSPAARNPATAIAHSTVASRSSTPEPAAPHAVGSVTRMPGSACASP